MATYSGLVGASCAHLGGDPTVLWIIEVDTGSRGEATGKTVNVEANGHDIYVPLTDVCFASLTAI
jgi:hypothetical protein